jgi:hypothetical protein
MGRIQVYHLQVPQIKNRDRAKENGSLGHSFSSSEKKQNTPTTLRSLSEYQQQTALNPVKNCRLGASHLESTREVVDTP